MEHTDFVDVILVSDVAHDLLHQILHGHDAGAGPVFIHHHGHLVLSAHQLIEKPVGGLRLRHEVCASDEVFFRLETPGGVGSQPDNVPRVHDADDVVQVLPVDQNPRVAVVLDFFDYLLHRALFLHRGEVHDGHQHVFHVQLTEREDAADHLALENLHVSVALFFHERFEFLPRDERRALPVSPFQPHNGADERADEPDQGIHDQPGAPDDARQHGGEHIGAGLAITLGNHLAEHHEQRDHQGDRKRLPIRRADEIDGRDGGQGNVRHETRVMTGENRAHEPFGFFQKLQGEIRTPVPSLRLGAQTGAVRGNDGDLSTREQRFRQEKEQADDDDREDIHFNYPPVFARAPGERGNRLSLRP